MTTLPTEKWDSRRALIGGALDKQRGSKSMELQLR
jgi:hypothetical protein